MDERTPIATVDPESEAILGAWERAGLTGSLAWPADAPRHRLRLPAADTEDALDAVATVLDALDAPETVFCHLEIGRRADFGPRRTTLESLSGHADVVVADHQTAGTVPLTSATFEALAELYDDLAYAVVRDAAGEPVLEQRTETLTFVASPAAVETLSLPESLTGRLERVD